MESARWNYEATDTEVLVCREYHEKGEKCQYERMHPAEIVQMLNTYRSRILELERLVALRTRG